MKQLSIAADSELKMNVFFIMNPFFCNTSTF